jgi:signal transduction histidine kinase
MKYWFRGKTGGAFAFLAIALLVVGGLGWATYAALQLEQERAQARAQTQRMENLRPALWRMDALVSSALAQEDSRPYSHFSAIFAPSSALTSKGMACSPGTVLEPSPLLGAELPEWMLLHFQTSEESGWESPQVLSPTLTERLKGAKVQVPSPERMQPRSRLLAKLGGRFPHRTLVALLQPHNPLPGSRENTIVLAQGPWNYNASNQADAPNQFPEVQANSEFSKRANVQQITRGQQGKVASKENELDADSADPKRNGEDWFSGNRARPVRGEQVSVHLDSMVPFWLESNDGRDYLVFARLVSVGSKQVCQGIVLDWPRLQALLLEQVTDLFPQAKIVAVKNPSPARLDDVMSALPIQLDSGPFQATTVRDWTPLRIGLILAWLAALIALAAVGLGGWSLIDLSQRRTRFVSTVTHELRTPLTTLRLYLDMLAGGLITDEKQKAEYLHTLNAETERLNRLVGNVLDFSRLENQRPQLNRVPVVLADLMEQVRASWQGRCQDTGKELIVENELPAETVFQTDTHLVQQVLGNLIDNACKYSHGAEDRRIWLRARMADTKEIILEVEDRGPGVPARESRSIFRPFRRGRDADVTAGGVGLGLALAQRWAQLLGGRLSLQTPSKTPGACFRVNLPLIE